MILIAKEATIIACSGAPQICGKTYTIIDETKNTFVLSKEYNLKLDKKIRVLKPGLEIMVENTHVKCG